jgi:hypothetical protein
MIAASDRFCFFVMVMNHRLLSASHSTRDSSNGNDLDKVVDPGKGRSVAGVQPRRVGVGGRRRHEVQHPGWRLAARGHKRGGDFAIARDHASVNR